MAQQLCVGGDKTGIDELLSLLLFMRRRLKVARDRNRGGILQLMLNGWTGCDGEERQELTIEMVIAMRHFRRCMT